MSTPSVDEIVARGGDADDVLMVTAHQTMVYVDLPERKACPIPDDYREKVVALEGDDVEH